MELNHSGSVDGQFERAHLMDEDLLHVSSWHDWGGRARRRLTVQRGRFVVDRLRYLRHLNDISRP